MRRHKLPWRGIVILRGHLDGGYVPPNGVALRMLIKLPHRARPSEPVPFRTRQPGELRNPLDLGDGKGSGHLPLRYSGNRGRGWLPFSTSRSLWIRITFGVPTPHPTTTGGLPLLVHHQRITDDDINGLDFGTRHAERGNGSSMIQGEHASPQSICLTDREGRRPRDPLNPYSVLTSSAQSH